MTVYTSKEHSENVKRVLLFGSDVTNRTTEVAIWPGPSGWGIGYVVLFKWPEGIRHYGIVKVELGKGRKQCY